MSESRADPSKPGTVVLERNGVLDSDDCECSRGERLTATGTEGLVLRRAIRGADDRGFCAELSSSTWRSKLLRSESNVLGELFLCWAARAARTTAKDPVREAVELVETRRSLVLVPAGTARCDVVSKRVGEDISEGSADKLAVNTEGYRTEDTVSVTFEKVDTGEPEVSESMSTSPSLIGGLGGGPCMTLDGVDDWSNGVVGRGAPSCESLVKTPLTMLMILRARLISGVEPSTTSTWSSATLVICIGAAPFGKGMMPFIWTPASSSTSPSEPEASFSR